MSGKDRKHCSFYRELNEILGTRAASEPPLILQTNPSAAGKW